MDYIEYTLAPGEKVLATARVHWMAYIYGILWLATMLTPGGITGPASTELALTDKRVIGKTGMFMRKSVNLPYAKIGTIKVRQSLLGILFNYGSFTISGLDGGKVKFRAIIDPIDLKMQIEEAVEKTMLGKRLSDFAKLG